MSRAGYVTMVGFVATEPRLNTFDGTDVANLRIGSTRRVVDRETGEWRDGDTLFYGVRCRWALARNAKESLRKGQPIVVAGRLHARTYQDRNGQPRSDLEIDADTIGFDLARGVAQFTWVPRSSPASPALARGEAIRAGLEDEDSLGTARTGGSSGMFDDQAIAEMEHELGTSTAEPTAG